MQTPLVLVLLLAALFGLGCATRKVAISEPLPSISLATSQRVRTTGGLTVEVTLPAGDYRPAFRDGAGIYYRPAAEVIIWGKASQETYLFVPNDRSKPVALWMEGAIKVDPLSPPVEIS